MFNSKKKSLSFNAVGIDSVINANSINNIDKNLEYLQLCFNNNFDCFIKKIDIINDNQNKILKKNEQNELKNNIIYQNFKLQNDNIEKIIELLLKNLKNNENNELEIINITNNNKSIYNNQIIIFILLTYIFIKIGF